MPYIGISSTDLRSACRRGLSLRYLVPEAVEAYISEHGLYRRVSLLFGSRNPAKRAYYEQLLTPVVGRLVRSGRLRHHR